LVYPLHKRIYGTGPPPAEEYSTLSWPRFRCEPGCGLPQLRALLLPAKEGDLDAPIAVIVSMRRSDGGSS
jgi:hypothetical protein